MYVCSSHTEDKDFSFASAVSDVILDTSWLCFHLSAVVLGLGRWLHSHMTVMGMRKLTVRLPESYLSSAVPS